MSARAPYAIILASILAAACTAKTSLRVEDAAKFSRADSALVAFSVTSIEPFVLRQLSLVEPSGDELASPVGNVAVTPEDRAEQLLLIRVPTEGARFGPLRFQMDGDWWETVEEGPPIVVEPGSLTYLGRIEAYSVLMRRYADSGRLYPAFVKLRISDESETDLPQMATRYAVPSTMPLLSRVPGNWAEPELVELRYVPKPRADRRRDQVGRIFGGMGPVGPELTPRRRKN